MEVPNKTFLSVLSVLLASSALAADRAAPPGGVAAKMSQEEPHVRPCATGRIGGTEENGPQGPQLWGTLSAWDEDPATPPSDLNKSVLVSVNAEFSKLKADKNLQLDGRSSEGQAVKVVICKEEKDASLGVTWYSVEVLNNKGGWQNPCRRAKDSTEEPRALAVSGVWDSNGAHLAKRGKLTLACEGGVIAKCVVTWGYKPGASKDSKSLAPLHQACTRMARADYCGNGIPHTKEGTNIDVYDVLGVNQPSTPVSEGDFEAAWGPEGAVCLARTRLQEDSLEKIQQECTGRFKKAVAVPAVLGEICVLTREGKSLADAPLRNQGHRAAQAGD